MYAQMAGHSADEPAVAYHPFSVLVVFFRIGIFLQLRNFVGGQPENFADFAESRFMVESNVRTKQSRSVFSVFIENDFGVGLQFLFSY